MSLPAHDLAKVCARLRKVLQSGEIVADEKPVAVFPTEEDLCRSVLPLLEWCKRDDRRGSSLARSQGPARGLVGIAGPAGAGKSLLTAWLAAAAKALEWPEFAFLSLDGYHLPNAVLESRAGFDPDGKKVSLRKLKGAPQTFDADRLLADLRALKSEPGERRLPAYSRVLHEPEPGRTRIGPEVRWVFVEGNFLFLDVSPWREIRELFDRKIYLDADDEALLARLARRHASAGRDAEWIREHFRRTDGPNIRLIRTTAHFADVVFRWEPSGRLSEVNSGR